MDEKDGLYLCAALGAIGLCLLLHGKLLRMLAENQAELHNDVEFLKEYAKMTEAAASE